jgi:polyisoprenyl-teichoic acid--peptidoglycan teichoic acid transferase
VAFDPFDHDEGSVGGLPRVVAFFLGFAFTVFVAGGCYSGWLFVANYQELASRRVTVTIPGAPPVVLQAPDRLPNPIQDAARRGPQIPSLPAFPPPTIILPEWQGTERINITLLGVDQRDDEPLDGSRADTVMLLSIDPVSRTAAMISFPRDLWVSIPGYYNQRINVAHSVGGPELLQRTLDANFALKSKYFARVSFRGFEQIVDTVGGVIVDVERPIKDDEYPTDDYGYQRIYIPAGPQVMDGRTALQYARSRHSENDFGRARRQQRVLVSLRDRAMQLNMLPKAPTLIGLAQQTVSTNFSATELLALARLASDIERDKIVNLVVDTQYADPFKGSQGEDLLRPRTPEIRRAIERALAESVASRTEGTRIEVLNGTSRSNLATNVGVMLREQGHQNVRVGSADRMDVAESSVIYYNGKQEAARAIATELQLPLSAVKSGAGDSQLDIRVTLGRDYTGS